jgi:hypothetical protein
MHRNDRESAMTYAPLDTPKPVAPDVWIVDGPLIRFGAPWPKVPFPTRMTLVRLGSALFVHSPTRLTPSLRDAVLSLGTPRWIVAPNRIHYWWVPDWKAAWPEAEAWLAPRVREQAHGRIAFAAHALEGCAAYPWDGAIDTAAVAGSFMTEFEFFHRPSRTLVLADLVENFEPARLPLLMRWLTRLGGVQAPDGGMPRDLRATFARDRPRLRAAIGQLLAWDPERVILAHGRWFERDGAAHLRRAFRWLLDT